MYNIIAFLLIIIFVPVATLIGIKMYKPSNSRLMLIFVWVLFGCELVRFFYNASLYENAITPSSDLTLTYLSIMCALALFALYNKNKIGSAAKTIFVLTALTPLVLGLFDSTLYTNPLDTFAVLKALYFVEAALAITIALLYIVGSKERLVPKQLILALCFLVCYVGLNALARFYFESGDFNLVWGLSMIAMLLASVCVYFLAMLWAKRKNDISPADLESSKQE